MFRRKKKELTQEEQNKRKRRKKRRRIILMMFLIPILIVMIILGIKFMPTIYKLHKESDKIVKKSTENDFKKNTPSVVYDANGNEVLRLKGEIEVRYTDYKDLPKNLVNAVVSYEDKRFYKHHGVDYKGIMRALVSYITHKGQITQGGSTITQQLVKRTYLTSEQTWKRKVEEMFIAKGIEDKYSKEQILEFYLNNIYYGNNAYGIRSASLKYFGKELKDLSLSECAFLSVIPNNPEGLNPYYHLGEVTKKRDISLKYMLEQGYITEKEYNIAINEKIQLKDKNTITQNTNSEFQSLEGLITNDLAKIIIEKEGFKLKFAFDNDKERKEYETKYNELMENARNKIYISGYKIHTSIDFDKQREIQKMLDDELSVNSSLSAEGKYALQSALTVIDNDTGLIISAIGGRTSPINDYVNRSYQTYRQNGSSMKPLAVYTPAFEEKYYPFSVMNDSPVESSPNNSSGYYGDISLRYAVEISSNTVASKVFNSITPKFGISYVQKMELSKIVDKDFNQSFALGGMTYGTNTNELAGAYSTIARGGEFIRPSTIKRVETVNGDLYYEHSNKGNRVFKSSSTFMMTDVLKGVLTEGTARGYTLENGIVSAGKTGSTDEYKDIWFAGYTPKYTTVTWVGYDTPKAIEGEYLSIRLKLWKRVMDYMHQGMSNLDFTIPDTITQVSVNWKGEIVPDDYYGAYKEYVPIDRLPSKEESIRSQQVITDVKNQLDEYINSNEITTIEKYDEVCTKSQALLNSLLEKENSSYVKYTLNSYLTNKLKIIGEDLQSELLPKIKIPTSTSTP